MTDKAVSTEDLCLEIPRNASLDAARLEAVIKTLIDNKTEALKNEKRKSSSITSSPKLLINKLRGTSTSTVSSKDKDDPSTQSQTSRYKCGCQKDSDYSRKDSKASKKSDYRPSSMTPPRSMKHSKVHNCDRILHFSEEDASNDSCGFLHKSQPCSSVLDCSEVCFCKREPNGEIRMHFEDDYISLKIEECEELDWDEAAARRALRRAQRKKHRRRKRRMKKHLAISAMQIPVREEYKDLDPDELSQRARWTIVVTACLLLFMCLLLVGITLRMAPIIDDMVRKENEELMNSLSLDPNSHKSLHNSTASVPFV